VLVFFWNETSYCYLSNVKPDQDVYAVIVNGVCLLLSAFLDIGN